MYHIHARTVAAPYKRWWLSYVIMYGDKMPDGSVAAHPVVDLKASLLHNFFKICE